MSSFGVHYTYSALLPKRIFRENVFGESEKTKSINLKIAQDILNGVNLLNGICKVIDVRPFYLVKDSDWSCFMIIFEIYKGIFNKTSEQLELISSLNSLSGLEIKSIYSSYKIYGLYPATIVRIRKFFKNNLFKKPVVENSLKRKNEDEPTKNVRNKYQLMTQYEEGQIEEERLEKEQLEKEQLEQERLEKERLEQERLEQERLEKERLEQERLEQERLEQERLEQQKIEQAPCEKVIQLSQVYGKSV
jgi:hypothetical protein